VIEAKPPVSVNITDGHVVIIDKDGKRKEFTVPVSKVREGGLYRARAAGKGDKTFVYGFGGKDMKPGTFMKGDFTGGEGVRGMHHVDMKALYESLTQSQIQRMDGQGYLNYSDLLPKQKAMLGGISGTWTLSYSDGNRKMTIKSDH